MRKNLILIGAAIVIAAVPVSCAVLGVAAEKVATAVDRYCEEPLSHRELYGNSVNSYLVGTGHVVHVHCSGDPTTTP